MYKSLIASLFLILLTSASIFFILHVNTTNLAEENRNHMDSYMKNTIYEQYNKEGQLVLHLKSPIVRHYSLSNNAEFEKPQILIYDEKEAPWEINSLYGRSLSNTNLIDLWDEVVIHRNAVTGNPETTIRTTALTVNSKEQTAETNQAATITQPHSVVQSIGLKTNFKTGITQLSAHARVDYDGQGNNEP